MRVSSRASSKNVGPGGGKRASKLFRSVLTVVLALAFVPIVPASAFAEGPAGTGPLTVDGVSIFANGAPITITEDATSGIDIAWPAGTYDGITYKAGYYNYTADDADIYGGSQDKSQTSSSVTLESGQVDSIFGGGFSFDESTSGDIDTAGITVIGGTVDTVFGGGLDYSSVGASTVFISGGTVTGIYGGGDGATWDASARANLKSYYEQKVAGGADDPALYCENYVGTSDITVQGDAKVQTLYGGGLDSTIVDTSTVTMPEGNIATVNFLCATGSGGLVYNATDSIQAGTVAGGSMPASGAAMVYTGLAGNVSFEITGGTIDGFFLGTCQATDTTGEIFGRASVAAKDGTLPAATTFIMGRFSGDVSITGANTYQILPPDGSSAFEMLDGATWEGDDATFVIPVSETLTVDGTFIAKKIVNNGKIIIEDGSIATETLTNKGKVYVTGDTTLTVDHIINTGVILKSDESTVNGAAAYHVVTVSSGTGGTADPEGNIVVVDGAYQEISYTADITNSFKQLTDNGVVVSNPANPYKAGGDSADHTIVVSFYETTAVTLDQTSVSFPEASPGYTQPAAQTVTITNTGADEVTLSNLSYGSDFTAVMGWSGPTLLPNESTTFTIQPNAGLGLGEYKDYVILSYSGIAGAEMAMVAVDFNVAAPVATIGSKGYPSLEAAFAAAQSGDTITIQQDITLYKTLTTAVGGTVTLTSAVKSDGSSYTISPSDTDFTGDSLIAVGPTSNPSTLSLMNINLIGNGVNVRAVSVFDDGTLNINTGTMISGFSTTTSAVGADVSGAAVHTSGAASVNMNGGMITGNSSVTYGGAIAVGIGGTFTMRGGQISGNHAGADGGGVWVEPNATMTWTGGTIAGNEYVMGGYNDIYVDAQAAGAGTLVLKTPVTETDGEGTLTTHITGATYEANRAALSIQKRGVYGTLRTGDYAWNPGINDWIDAAAVARITPVSGSTATYHTLQDALAAAGSGNTIYIVQDVTLSEPAEVVTDGSLTIASDPTKSNYGTETPEYYSIIANTSFDASTGHSLVCTENSVATSLTFQNINLVGNGSANIRAIRVFDGDTLTMDSGSTIQDFAMWGSTTVDSLDGAAIYAEDDATVYIEGGEISGNSTTTTGGAIYLDGASTMTMLDGTITGNTAAAGSGGVWVGSEAGMSWSSGTISDNLVGTDKVDVFVAAGEKGSGLIALYNNIAVPATTVIEGVHADASYSGMMIWKGSSYGDISCPDETGFFVWDSAQKCWTRAAALSMNSTTDKVALYGTLLEAFNSTKTGEENLITILPLADTMVTGNVTFNGDVTVTSDEPVTVTFTNGAELKIGDDSATTVDTLALNRVTFDIVKGHLTNNGTIETTQGGALYPTLAAKTEVKDTAAKVGVETSLTFEAVQTAGTTTDDITYQWYECSNDHGNNPTPLLGASESTFSTTYANAKTLKHYYTCVASLEGVTLSSAIATVTVGTSTNWTRLYGTGRLDTMEKIVQTIPYADHSCSYIIVTTGWGYADALSASGLAGIHNAPIITTDGTTLSAQAATEIARLAKIDASTTVYVLGGEGSISTNVANAIAGIIGSDGGVQRIAGSSRIETNLKIYEAGEKTGPGWSDTAIVTNGWAYADALSIGSYAYASHSPVFLTTNGVLSDEAVADIKAGGFTNVLILGSTNAVSDDVITQIGIGGTVQHYYRLGGANRIETSALICNWASGHDTSASFQPSVTMSYDGMAASDAWSYPDALASIALLGRSQSVLMLVDESDTTKTLVDTYVKPESSMVSQGYVLGSTKSVSDTVLGWFEADTQ